MLDTLYLPRSFVIVIVIVIVISAKSTNFTTNTRYHVDSSVDEPHRLQQRVLVLVFGSVSVMALIC